MNNDGNDTITVTPGMGLTLGFSNFVEINSDSAVVIRVQILSETQVYVHVLSSESTPVGTINVFAGSSSPAGYLLCNGSAVSRELYSSLFTVIGESYGPGDGILTFNLPDLRGRIPVGQTGSSAYFNTLAGSGGITDLTLTINQIPAHAHTGTTDAAGAHSHTHTFTSTNKVIAYKRPTLFDD